MTFCQHNQPLAQSFRFFTFVSEFTDDSPPENFANFLDAINKSLRPLDMEIRRGISEDDGSVHYGLVSAPGEDSTLLLDLGLDRCNI